MRIPITTFTKRSSCLPITSFFNKSPKKKSIETGLHESTFKGGKGKEEVADATSTIEARKFLLRKLVRAAQLNINLEPLVTKDKEVSDAPAQAKLAKEKEKAHKQVASTKLVKEKARE